MTQPMKEQRSSLALADTERGKAVSGPKALIAELATVFTQRGVSCWVEYDTAEGEDTLFLAEGADAARAAALLESYGNAKGS